MFATTEIIHNAVNDDRRPLSPAKMSPKQLLREQKGISRRDPTSVDRSMGLRLLGINARYTFTWTDERSAYDFGASLCLEKLLGRGPSIPLNTRFTFANANWAASSATQRPGSWC
ncbi:hypothetical protein BST61_g1381 [Cercospora zeina]